MNTTRTDITIRLTGPELRHATYIGVERFLRVIDGNLRPVNDQPQTDALAHHILGAWGECVVAKLTRRYWADGGGPDRHAPDVGLFHVRTNSRSNGDLILRKPDPDDGRFVLVVVDTLPTFRVIGWCDARDAKRDEYWGSPNHRPPAWWVPQSALHPFDTI